MTHRTPYERIVDLAAGDLGPEDVPLEDAARETVLNYRAAARLLRTDDGVEPPPATVAAAKAIFDRAPASLASGLRELVARLVLDTRLQPLAVRDGSPERHHLAYTGEGFEVDLSLEPGTGSRRRLRGQIDADDVTPSEIRALDAEGGSVIAVAPCDERGLFLLELGPGRYDLRARHGDAEMVIPGVEVT